MRKIDKKSENSTDVSKYHNTYAPIARMSTNEEIPRRNYGDISQLTHWILDLGANFHMTPETSDFILGLLVETDKYIKVSDENYVTDKKTE